MLSTSLPIFNNYGTLKAFYLTTVVFLSAEAGTRGEKGEKVKKKRKGTEKETIARDQVRRWSCWNSYPVNWLIPMSE